MQYTFGVTIFVACHDIMSSAYILLRHISVISFSSSFFKFAKRYLEHADMLDIDPETDGPAIAADIVDCSSLTTECIKCAKKCDGSQPFRICESSYNPARHFHMRCILQAQIVDSVFKCQICDPTKREEYCFKCGGKPDNTILNCKDMCQSFIHKACLPLGMEVYRCGICMI